ncbi:MAG: DUF4118 domain-containing protein [Pseudolabrys sp.]
MNFDRVLTELRNIGFTMALVAITTLGVYFLVWQPGITHGSVVFIIPVVIAAAQWGIVSALIASIAGVLASAFFFFPPLYTLRVRDPHEVVNLTLFIFVAIVVSQLAMRLRRQAEIARQREIDMRDLYAFSRRLAVAFGVSDIHAAIEDHLANVTQRKVALLASGRNALAAGSHRAGIVVPDEVLAKAAEAAAIQSDPVGGVTIKHDNEDVWLVRAVSPRTPEFGVIAINLGRETQEGIDSLRARVDTVLADATATLDRLGVAHAINEAHMRSQTDQLREALIGSVSHELRTPLASILGAATVLSAAPALAGQDKLQALVNDVRNEAERLNHDIQNLLDASRISSDGLNPHTEWADPADIIHSAIERCRRRFGSRRIVLDIPRDLPLVHIDPVLVQQALVQIFDNAAKYSHSESQIRISARAMDGHMAVTVSDQGTGLTPGERAKMWDRFVRGERHAATTNGSGLGLWIANAFIGANGGKMHAISAGADLGTAVSIELPVRQVAATQMEGDADE